MHNNLDSHFNRRRYCVVGEGCTHSRSNLASAAEASPSDAITSNDNSTAPFKFGRLFDQAKGLTDEERAQKVSLLVRLGQEMNKEILPLPEDSNIPSGYTYLGQFIAHEVTFDKTTNLQAIESDPQSWRSPQLDLDSLYGNIEDSNDREALYDKQNSGRLKVGVTHPQPRLNKVFDCDLPRDNAGKALVGDPRNDENIAIAQMHLAFIKFHNKVVESLEKANVAKELIFDRAREKVVNSFHSIILNDFLPRLLDERILEEVRASRAQLFVDKTASDLFMPLEFSAAAFRFGHSMVRSSYQWNAYHSDEISVPARLRQLMDQTEFSGSIGKPGGNLAIDSDWIIDWRRFFDFSSLGYPAPKSDSNKAGKIDRVFSLHLEKLPGFPHNGLAENLQPIMVRNLLRGFALDLPSGETVASKVPGAIPLQPDQLAGDSEEIKELLNSPLLKGQTPLYYYILREAELNGGEKLGEVGSYIVAQTLIGLMQASKHSSFNSALSDFRMVDLLHQADVVDPIGRHLDSIYAPQVLHASHP
ncbi:MAG TPA: heme peroxidase family protein [Pyrinomonadaceae bacterium]|nr:heme peroxidase family protein [Pyrinomonadaceae bacterium]